MGVQPRTPRHLDFITDPTSLERYERVLCLQGPCKAETFTSTRLLYARQGLYAQRAHALAKDRHTGLSLNKRWPEIG